MSLKSYKPTTPGTRDLVLVDRSALWKGRPEKSLVEGKKSTGGRNNAGRITSRHKGGGHKKLYRIVDFKRFPREMPAVVERVEYDPNRSAFIALVKYEDGEKKYILAPQKLAVGDTIVAGDNVPVKEGNAMILRNIPVGTQVHNIEMKVGKGGQIGRSAGATIQLVGHDMGYAILRLPSGELRRVQDSCMATIGSVSNEAHKNRTIAKAGRNRWLGKRPHVRGVAMNPVDHPMGGGEGKSSGGRHPVSPWGQSAKGKKTRARAKPSNKMIITRRKTGR